MDAARLFSCQRDRMDLEIMEKKPRNTGNLPAKAKKLTELFWTTLYK